MTVQERYTPYTVAADTTIQLSTSGLGGFLCKTAGTISCVKNPSGGNPSSTVIDTHPVSVGIYYPLPFYLGTNGGTFTTAGGASGVLGVA